MPEPVYDLRTGKQVAVAYWPEELPEPKRVVRAKRLAYTKRIGKAVPIRHNSPRRIKTDSK